MKEPAKRRDALHMRVSPFAGSRGPRGRLLGSSPSSASALCLQFHRETRAAARCIWLGAFVHLKHCQSIFLSKTRVKYHVHFSLSRTVSLTGRGGQCWNPACPSAEPPPRLQVQESLFYPSGKQSHGMNFSLRGGFTLSLRWEASKNTLTVDRKAMS